MNSRYTSYMKYRDFGNKVSSIPLETRSLCPNPCKGLISSVLEKRAGFEIVGVIAQPTVLFEKQLQFKARGRQSWF